MKVSAAQFQIFLLAKSMMTGRPFKKDILDPPLLQIAF